MVSAYTDLHVEGGVDYFAVFAPFLSCGGEKTVACEPPKDGREVIVPVDDARASKDPLQVPGFCYHHVQFVPQVKSADRNVTNNTLCYISECYVSVCRKWLMRKYYA